jgi:3',5'-cyclic AMP phosphodiesterase CpdA
MLIAHLTDLHIRPFGAPSHGRLPSHLRMLRAIARLEALSPRPDLVLITGDLTHYGHEEEYEACVALLRRLSIPWRVLPGNHDRRAAFRAAFAPLQRFETAGGFLNFAERFGDLVLIGLDSLAEGASHGELCAARLAWLEGELIAAEGRPVVIALHHPPILVGVAGMDRIPLREGARELEALVARFPNVERLICGHHHAPIQARFGGSLLCAGSSLVAQSVIDLRAGGVDAWRDEPAQFHLHTLVEGRMVSHLVMVETFDGPHPFV